MDINVVKNNIDNRKYFISVMPVKKSSLMLEMITDKKLGDYRKIILEAYIYDNNQINELPLTSPERENKFIKLKPVIALWLGVKEDFQMITQVDFQNQINEVISKVNITSDKDIATKLYEKGYEVSIHEIFSIFCSAKVKSFYIFERFPRTTPIDKLCNSIFVGFILNKESYELHLVNPTKTEFKRVFSLTGAFSGDMDGLSNTSKAVKELGVLEGTRSVLLEKGSRTELDWTIWYHFDLYEMTNEKPLKVRFGIKYGAREFTFMQLPVLDKEGAKIGLLLRESNEIIEEEIKHMDMEGGYKLNEELTA